MQPAHIPFQQQLITKQQSIPPALTMILQLQLPPQIIPHIPPRQPTTILHTPAHRLIHHRRMFLPLQHPHTLLLMNTNRLRLLLIPQRQTMEQAMTLTIW